MVKKVGPTGRPMTSTTSHTMNDRPSQIIQVRSNLMSNCIDLTDEEDNQRAQRHSLGDVSQPPALVAFQNQSRQRTIITAQPKANVNAASGPRMAQKYGQYR